MPPTNRRNSNGNSNYNLWSKITRKEASVEVTAAAAVVTSRRDVDDDNAATNDKRSRSTTNGFELAVERSGGDPPSSVESDEQSLSVVVRASEGEGQRRVETRVRGGVVASLITRVFHIQRHELSKFLYMSFMMFAIIYVFTMTR